jgi:hypothetical protein
VQKTGRSVASVQGLCCRRAQIRCTTFVPLRTVAGGPIGRLRGVFQARITAFPCRRLLVERAPDDNVSPKPVDGTVAKLSHCRSTLLHEQHQAGPAAHLLCVLVDEALVIPVAGAAGRRAPSRVPLSCGRCDCDRLGRYGAGARGPPLRRHRATLRCTWNSGVGMSSDLAHRQQRQRNTCTRLARVRTCCLLNLWCMRHELPSVRRCVHGAHPVELAERVEGDNDREGHCDYHHASGAASPGHGSAPAGPLPTACLRTICQVGAHLAGPGLRAARSNSGSDRGQVAGSTDCAAWPCVLRPNGCDDEGMRAKCAVRRGGRSRRRRPARTFTAPPSPAPTRCAPC